MRIIHIQEPKLEFAFGQVRENPQDGLFFYGPCGEMLSHKEVIRYGVIATEKGLAQFSKWANRARRTIEPLESGKRIGKKTQQYMVPFPGIEAAFGISFPKAPVVSLTLDKDEILKAIMCENSKEGIHKAVEIYSKAIEAYVREEDEPVTLWFVILPDKVKEYGRPQARLPKNKQQKSDLLFSEKQIKDHKKQGGLLPFPELDKALEIDSLERNFHHLLKARLLRTAVIQIVLEGSLLTPEEYAQLLPIHRKTEDPCVIAWNLCTTAYYKSIGKPWKLASNREGVCYVGLTFKRKKGHTQGNACCAAQMFLDSGDGLVFKGAVGPWYSEESNEYHLSFEKAAELMDMVVSAYSKAHEGNPPKELFIHGKTHFNADEWKGFESVVPDGTKLVGIRIIDTTRNPLIGCKLYTSGDYVVTRGTALIVNEATGYLWTRGFVTRLDTYPGWDTPNPLLVEVDKGEADIQTVMTDILSLTKVNYNNCKYADGRPVTLKFSEAVGDILTSAPSDISPVWPFKHYI